MISVPQESLRFTTDQWRGWPPYLARAFAARPSIRGYAGDREWRVVVQARPRRASPSERREHIHYLLDGIAHNVAAIANGGADGYDPGEPSRWFDPQMDMPF